MAVFTIMALSSCTCLRYLCTSYSQPDENLRKPILVKIKTKDLDGKKPKIVPRVVMLKYGTNQEVEWKIDRDVRFTINFDIDANKNGLPFRTDQFNDKENKSGRAIADPGDKEKAYWYSLDVEGFEPIDPIIIIW
jgi:hypothetical protein